MAAAELERQIDLTAMGFGRPAAARVVGNMLQNVALHCGEIAALKAPAPDLRKGSTHGAHAD